jgi:hypothetical protein
MSEFEYTITRHPAQQFNKLVYFCGQGAGQCDAREVPDAEMGGLAELLNERGRAGWELVQLHFGADSLVAIWKRARSG